MSFCSDASSRETKCTLPPSGPDFVSLSESVTLFQPAVGSSHSINLNFKDSPVKMDVYLLLDATGSMNEPIMAIRKNFPKLAAGVKATSDAAFGVGIFRDERDLDNGFEQLQSISTDSGRSATALSKITAVGGQDAEEANLVALYKLATDESIGWRDASRRIVIYVADEPGHEPSCLGNGLKIDRAMVVDALNKAGISVIAISYAPGKLNVATKQLGCSISTEDAGPGQGTAIVKGTGGILLERSPTNFDVGVMLKSIRKLTKRVTLSKNTCARYLKTTYGPPLPAVLSGSVRLAVTFMVRPTSCSLKADFSCQISFRESGVVLKPFVVRLEQVQNCK